MPAGFKPGGRLMPSLLGRLKLVFRPELEDARIRAAGSGIRIVIGLVIFDSAPVVTGRLGIVHGAMEHTRIITLETLGRLAAA